jgi:hypothetical protein
MKTENEESLNPADRVSSSKPMLKGFVLDSVNDSEYYYLEENLYNKSTKKSDRPLIRITNQLLFK